jgi:benzoyl-CoA reductase/2-hydroxyglutaryl-CoA dehydratase subunit BcrC/BadD/HgdB
LTHQDVIEQSRIELDQLVEAGRPAIGIFYSHTPFELLLAHGFTPTLLRTDPSIQGAFEASLQTFACSFARNMFSQREQGRFPILAGLVFPGNTCDSLQNLGDIWRIRFPEDRVFRLSFPVVPHGDSSVNFLSEELRLLSERLESVLGQSFSMDEYSYGLQLMSKFREVAQYLYVARLLNPSLVSLSDMASLVRGFLSAPSELALNRLSEVEEYTFDMMEKMGLLPLAKKVRSAFLGGQFTDIVIPEELARPRVAIIGGMTEPEAIATIVNSVSGLSDSVLVLDLLSFGFKTVFTHDPEGDDVFEAMAKSVLSAPREPTQEDLTSRRNYVKSVLQALSIDGLVICEQSFCDPDEFEAPSLERVCREIGIPVVRLPLDSELSDLSRLGVRIQSFLETLAS